MLLGLLTIQEFNLDNCFIAYLDTTFDLGDSGTVNLKRDKNVRPTILPSRKIPLALRTKVKQELYDLINRNVISFAIKPTEWVRQVAVVEKPNGDLRIYIDPQPLNAALKREHFKSSTVDDG